MARRKSDAERGPLGAWAYNTRDLLSLSVPDVLARLPSTYTEPTLRKVEGGSARPGRRMWRELRTLYQQVASDAGMTIDFQPPLDPEPEHAGPPEPDLAAALTALTQELTAVREERRAWMRGVVAVLRAYDDGQVPEALLDALEPRLPEGAQL